MREGAAQLCCGEAATQPAAALSLLLLVGSSAPGCWCQLASSWLWLLLVACCASLVMCDASCSGF